MRKSVLLSLASLALLSACGGVGNTQTSSTPNPSDGSNSLVPVSLYFTDDGSIYPSLTVKVYGVNLCLDVQCQRKINLFNNSSGLEVDLAKLSGVLQYIGTVKIPRGVYNRLEVVLDKNLTIVDNQGQPHSATLTPMNERPNKPNTVACEADRCYIRFIEAVGSLDRMVIDFVLKEFVVDSNNTPWQVTDVKVVPLTSGNLPGIVSYEVYGTVQSINLQTNSFNINWMGNTYTVSIEQNTVCEINHTYIPAINCISSINPGMCLEIKSLGNPASANTLTAIKIENKNSNRCAGYNGSPTPPPNGGSTPPPNPPVGVYEVKGQVGNKGQNNTFILNNISIQVTNSTYCEYQHNVYKIGQPCFDELQSGWFVEVKVINGSAIKIERKDFYESYGNYNGNYGGGPYDDGYYDDDGEHYEYDD